MEDKKLTLENVQEIGLELLKEENGNSDELSVYYNYDEEIMKETMEEVREIKKANEYETLYDAFEDYLSEVNFDYIDDLKDELVKRTIENNSDYSYESEEYQELFDKAVEIVEEKFSINVNTNDILKNTRVRDVAVILSPNDNENFYLSNFNISEEFRDDVPQDSPMFFLIQSQGYEVEDLYDDEKVEKSPFLKSLSKEIKGFYEDVKIGFYTNMNLRDLIDLEETKQNIIIPKSTESDLVLEKEIVISRDKVKIYSDYSEEQEESEILTVGSVLDRNKKIELTDEKAFVPHEVDIEKVYTKAIIDLSKEDYENFIDKYSLDDDIQLAVSLGRLENKNKSMSGDLVAFKEDVKEMQGQLLNYLEEKGYIEKTEDNNYHISKETLDEDNFEKIKFDFVNEFDEIKNDVFLNNFTLEDLVERFDLKMPDFKIYTKDNEILFDSKDKHHNMLEIREVVVPNKGEEFWEDMNIYNAKDWESLLQDEKVIGIISRNSEPFNNYVDYSCDIFDEGEIYNKIQDELSIYADELRQEIKENTKDNVITKENLDKLKEKYKVEDYEVEKEEIEEIEKNEEVEKTNDKEIDF